MLQLKRICIKKAPENSMLKYGDSEELAKSSAGLIRSEAGYL